ncbi:MAG: hypothetical protein IIB56_11875 [Planctomycetes bacterium]|nr:hypothetical protein [Planctomycetota bacterium]MCH8118187.1 hypothetical protein [Planctomycetota bacterium]
MSLKNPKHLLIIGAVVVALMVGTVLLASYTNILPGSSDADSQTTTSCSKDTKPECTEEATTNCCGNPCLSEKPCPSESTKPGCAEETTTGGCPMSSPSATTNSGGCPKTSTATE